MPLHHAGGATAPLPDNSHMSARPRNPLADKLAVRKDSSYFGVEQDELIRLLNRFKAPTTSELGIHK